MNELWIIGVLGGGAGAAVGGPLLFRRLPHERWPIERLTGAWLMGGAAAMVLVGLRHGGMFTEPWDLVVEHFTNGTGLIGWTVLVTIIRRIAGKANRWPYAVSDHLVLPVTYWTVIAALGLPDIPFIWLLPVTIAVLVSIAATWRSARRGSDKSVERQLNAVFAFSMLFGMAQIVRTFFPRVIELREIVPFVMTVSFFAIGFALTGRVRMPPAPSYRKSGLTTDRARALIGQLDAAMETNAWYRDAGLTLGALASRMGTAPHTLSRALNQQCGQTLTEYLARWRMREAKERLVDPANDCFTVEGVARQSGFASRSAFYKAFKDAEGVTPTVYRDRARRAS